MKSEDPFDNCEPLTPERAKRLRHGEILYHVSYTNADGTPERWKVNGKPKLWKTRPGDVEVPIKNGLHRYGFAYHCECGDIDRYSNLLFFSVKKEANEQD